MKHLDKETCEYLVSLGCVSESEKVWTSYQDGEVKLNIKQTLNGVLATNEVPAFSLEDILRKDNAETIWLRDWIDKIDLVVGTFQYYPDTWPKEVAKLVKP